MRSWDGMYQEFNEPIDVIVLYEKGILRPLRFRWKGRSHKVVRVTASWKAPKGEAWMRHFSLMDENGDVFFLIFDERGTQWTISKVWVE